MEHRHAAVGVDLDGVHGDQVSEVINRANDKYGLALTYEDVTEWDLKIGDSSFKSLIAEAMQDPTYVLSMPVHDGAAYMLQALHPHYVIRIITVRPDTSMAHTRNGSR